MWDHAVWLGITQSEIIEKKIYQGDMNGRFAYFRCDVVIDQPAVLTAAITANSRYRLWVNGQPVLSGPCKGDRFRHYYEVVELSDYLQTGVNSFAVQVLLVDPNSFGSLGDERAPLLSVASLPAGHRLAFEGQIKSKDGELLADLTTGLAPWRVWLDNSFYLKCKAVNIYLGGIAEDIDFAATPANWKTGDPTMITWREPALLDKVDPDAFMRMVGLVPRFIMTERPIPLLYEQPGHLSAELGTAVFQGRETMTIPAQSRQSILFDAGSVTNAYMIYNFTGGKRARIALTYFEKFSKKDRVIHRADYQDGEIEGLTDELVLAGGDLRYEPFWFRTFRFLKINIETADEALIVQLPHWRKTGYPLNPVSVVSSSAAWVRPVWDMCVRTLQGCMTETYMDCPFYEQMQFPMDTRLQALFTYAVSTDVRLARKALIDFHHSMIPDGLIQGKYPCHSTQVISTFSLHYIYMLYEYYHQTGDTQILKALRSDIDAILEYYDRKIGSDGLLYSLDYWPFVDWQEAWQQSYGMPLAGLQGSSTIINLMYAYALDQAARICDVTDRPGLAAEYRNRQLKMIQSVQQRCWDEVRGLYREGPDLGQYSQHAQAWAVLNDMVPADKIRSLMQTAMNDPDIIACSFATSFELNRALEKAGMADVIESGLQRWVDLLDLGCTTCPETPGLTRSDCHAWSALPIYEMTSVLAGISSPRPGWPSVLIAPRLGRLPDLSGQVMTPQGLVKFSYLATPAGLQYEIELPHGLSGLFRFPDGTEAALKAGMNQGGPIFFS